jgi:hypothetical protein
MKQIRVVVVILAALATFYIMQLVVFSLIPHESMPWLPFVGSAGSAALVATYVWRQTASIPRGFATWVGLGALIGGGIGFSAGFFGPMALRSFANQGPLLGLLITGPLGFLVGGLGGGVLWFKRRRRADSPPASPMPSATRGRLGT